jgi:predicted small secreted protein
MKKFLLFILMGVTSALVLTGCNTTEGFGEDMQRAGEEIEEAAD